MKIWGTPLLAYLRKYSDSRWQLLISCGVFEKHYIGTRKIVHRKIYLDKFYLTEKVDIIKKTSVKVNQVSSSDSGNAITNKSNKIKTGRTVVKKAKWK